MSSCFSYERLFFVCFVLVFLTLKLFFLLHSYEDIKNKMQMLCWSQQSLLSWSGILMIHLSYKHWQFESI